MWDRASWRMIGPSIRMAIRAHRPVGWVPWRKEPIMHAVLITFHSDASLEELWEPFLAAAPAIRDVPGLIAKTWLGNVETLGGFYLFTDREAAEAYLDSEIIRETKAMPACSDFHVEHYDVVEAMSAITNGVGGAAVGARS
jgi:hypothetical protein